MLQQNHYFLLEMELKKVLNVPKSTKLQFPIESYELINNGNFPKKNIMLI